MSAILIWLLGIIVIYCSHLYRKKVKGRPMDGCEGIMNYFIWSILMMFLTPILLLVQNCLVSGSVIARLISGELPLEKFAVAFLIVNAVVFTIRYLPKSIIVPLMENFNMPKQTEDPKQVEMENKAKEFIDSKLDKSIISLLMLNFAISCFTMTWFMLYDGGTWTYLWNNPICLLYSVVLFFMVAYPFRALIYTAKNHVIKAAEGDFEENESDDSLSSNESISDLTNEEEE